jgi:hypothetical protein
VPEMQSVASMYPPTNPLSSLSSILGVQQQQQNLQTGAIQQQTAQAESTQKQQQSAELVAAQTAIKNGVSQGRYTNPDGSFNRVKAADDIQTVAPTYGQGISNQLLSGANEVVNNKQALQNLNQSQRAQIGGVIQSLAADPNIDNTKVINAMDGLLDQNPDPSFRRLVLSNMAHMPQSGKAADLQQALSSMSAGLTGQSPIGEGTNAAGQNQVVNKLTGARSVPQLGAGAINPTSSQVAGATTAATGGAKQVVEDPITHNKTIVDLQRSGGGMPVNPQRAPGQGESQVATAEGVTNRVQQAQAAANNTVQSQDALNRAKAILESPGSPSTGTQFENVKSLKNLMSSLGMDTGGANDMNTLTKNLARYEASRATQAGLGGTDAARELAHSGSPNTQLDNKALLGIVRQSLASEQAVASYANVQSKTNDPQKLAQNENAFRNIPNHIQAREFGMMRNPEEANAYLKSQGMTKAQMAAARQKIKEFDGQ